MNREPYWDYMGRKIREERTKGWQEKNFPPAQSVLTQEDIWKKEIAEMQKQIHELQMRIVELTRELFELKYEKGDVQFAGEINKNQLELNF